MAGKNITGMAFEGAAASWVSFDPVAGSTKTGDLQECTLEATISQVISGDSEMISSAGETLKTALDGVKGDMAVSLPSDQVLLRVLDLPTTDPAEIAGMVSLQIDKVSPFPIENMVMAHEVLARQESGVVVAGIAVQRSVVENLAKLLKSADIVPLRVDVTSLVWWRFIKKSGSLAESGRQVFIIFRDMASEFIVVRDGVPLLFRAFARQDDQSDAQFMVEICDELGYTLMSLELEQGAFSDFSISIWHSGLLDEDVLERPKELSNGNLEMTAMDVMPGLAEGIAARATQDDAIDLTPSDLIAERVKRGFRKKLAIALGGVAGVWLLALVVLFGGVQVQKMRLSSVKKELEKIQPASMEVRELRRKVSTINLYVDRSRSALECVREISLKQPQGVDLTMLNYRKGASLKVSGEAGNVHLIYAFKKNMDTSKLFESIVLDGPQRVKGREVFEIEAVMPGNEE